MQSIRPASPTAMGSYESSRTTPSHRPRATCGECPEAHSLAPLPRSRPDRRCPARGTESARDQVSLKGVDRFRVANGDRQVRGHESLWPGGRPRALTWPRHNAEDVSDPGIGGAPRGRRGGGWRDVEGRHVELVHSGVPDPERGLLLVDRRYALASEVRPAIPKRDSVPPSDPRLEQRIPRRSIFAGLKQPERRPVEPLVSFSVRSAEPDFSETNACGSSRSACLSRIGGLLQDFPGGAGPRCRRRAHWSR